MTRIAHRARIGCAGVAALAFFSAAATAIAQEPPHVRGDHGMQRLIDDAARRSSAIRESIDRLQALDVTIYVRASAFMPVDLDGRIALLATNGRRRYLVIELACGRSEVTQMAILGHELFHAIEIAQEPSAVNADTLADLFSRIGWKTSDSRGQRTFETEAAAAAGLRARRQLTTR